MRKILMFLILLGVIGCTSVPTSVKYDIKPSSPTNFAFVDARPLAQKSSKTDVEQRGDIVFIGDDGLSPTAPILLKSKLSERLGVALEGKKVILSSFDVKIINYKIVQNDQPVINPFGLFGELVYQFLTKPTEESVKKYRAWKDVYVTINGSVDGVAFEGSHTDAYKGGAGDAVVKSTVSSAIDDAVNNIEKTLSANK